MSVMCTNKASHFTDGMTRLDSSQLYALKTDHVSVKHTKFYWYVGFRTL